MDELDKKFEAERQALAEKQRKEREQLEIANQVTKHLPQMDARYVHLRVFVTSLYGASAWVTLTAPGKYGHGGEGMPIERAVEILRSIPGHDPTQRVKRNNSTCLIPSSNAQPGDEVKWDADYWVEADEHVVELKGYHKVGDHLVKIACVLAGHNDAARRNKWVSYDRIDGGGPTIAEEYRRYRTHAVAGFTYFTFAGGYNNGKSKVVYEIPSLDALADMIVTERAEEAERQAREQAYYETALARVRSEGRAVVMAARVFEGVKQLGLDPSIAALQALGYKAVSEATKNVPELNDSYDFINSVYFLIGRDVSDYADGRAYEQVLREEYERLVREA